jgi:hypothetical protein
MSIHTTCGQVSIGDTVEFSYPTGIRVGVVKDISSSINDITLSIYCHDKTGGYTLSAPHYNITRILPVEESAVSTQEEIKKPTRYNKKGKLECWDVIIDQEMNFLEGNIYKYVWRYKEKNGIEDLKKARVYLDKLISEVEKK